MNSSQLKCFINCDDYLRPNVVGVYPAYQLPRNTDIYPCAFIANTDTHDKPGKHWCAFYLKSELEAEFFDSYGKKPNYYSKLFSKYLEPYDTTENARALQSNHSNVCGLWCLFYLQQKFKFSLSMNSIFQAFSKSNLKENDRFIFNFMVTTHPSCFNAPLDGISQSCQPFCMYGM